MSIYTKTGDQGETSLFNGDRIPKSDNFMHALGTIDECNSALGIALSHLPRDASFEHLREQFIEIQHALFDIGAAVATPRTHSSEAKIEKTRFNAEATKKLEEWIDEMDSKLPKLRTFILPGGHPSSAGLHLARNICRRAERHAIPLNMHKDVSDNVMTYLNRLSDYFFMASRMANHLTGVEETSWRGK